MSSGSWAKCSQENCDNNIDSETPEKETRCRECRFGKKKIKCSTEDCYRKTTNKICNFCKNMSDIQCEKTMCDSFLTKDEVESGFSICIDCSGETRCHNWPECKFTWDGNAQHNCDLDYDMSTSEDD